LSSEEISGVARALVLVQYSGAQATEATVRREERLLTMERSFPELRKAAELSVSSAVMKKVAGLLTDWSATGRKTSWAEAKWVPRGKGKPSKRRPERVVEDQVLE
jgi:hypothetical protein